MFPLSITDVDIIAICLQGFFFGLYSGIFAMYTIQRQARSDKMKNILFYSLNALYILSLGNFIFDVLRFMSTILPFSHRAQLLLTVFSITLYTFCDFIAQSILIYRCWIVWHRDIRIVIIPSILAITFLGTALAGNGSVFLVPGQVLTSQRGYSVLSITTLVISLVVNALATALIVFRIFKVYRELRLSLDSQDSSINRGSRLRSIIFVIIESGMALFVVQLVRVVCSSIPTGPANRAFLLIFGVHQGLTGITPTIILVRVSMGLSFHDKESMEEVTLSLCFAPDDPNPFSETGSISIESHESREESEDIDILQFEAAACT